MNKIAVLQFPGSNCETETARVLQHVGLDSEIFRWNRLSRDLSEYEGYIIPGGFAYEDRVRAGVIAAKEPLFEALNEQAEAGKPILGICNGAQILLEAGLLPGLNPGQIEMALAHNYITYNQRVVRRGHHCGWVNLRYEQDSDRTAFTKKLHKGSVLPITLSHGEGRFTSDDSELIEQLEANQQILWRYCDDEGQIKEGLPTNPNGSLSNIAGICNPKGNVVALMPHPERSFYLRQVPSTWNGEWGDRRRSMVVDSINWNSPGPGYAIFESLFSFLNESK